jgi:hypothetical protein
MKAKPAFVMKLAEGCGGDVPLPFPSTRPAAPAFAG